MRGSRTLTRVQAGELIGGEITPGDASFMSKIAWIRARMDGLSRQTKRRSSAGATSPPTQFWASGTASAPTRARMTMTARAGAVMQIKVPTLPLFVDERHST